MNILHPLPQVITDFITASNKPDLAAYVDCFAEDAVVLDEGQEIHGKTAIKKWSSEHHFRVNVTLEPREAKQEGDEITVLCKIDGDFDKAGLPDPLLLDFHFRIRNNKIIHLMID